MEKNKRVITYNSSRHMKYNSSRIADCSYAPAANNQFSTSSCLFDLTLWLLFCLFFKLLSIVLHWFLQFLIIILYFSSGIDMCTAAALIVLAHLFDWCKSMFNNELVFFCFISFCIACFLHFSTSLLCAAVMVANGGMGWWFTV